MGQSQIGAYAFLDGHRVAGRQNIRPAVVVVVEEPGGESMARALDTGLARYVGKGAVVVVVEERAVPW